MKNVKTLNVTIQKKAGLRPLRSQMSDKFG